MRVPRYWEKAVVEATDRDGNPLAIACWGWSETSREEAKKNGREKARNAADRKVKGEMDGGYLYSDRTIREEVLKEIEAASGHVAAFISRNRYGCQVLNSEEVMFVDVDIPDLSLTEQIVFGLRRLFSRDAESPVLKRRAEALEKLKDFVTASPETGVRVYETFGGLRYILTHRPASATSDQTERAMTALGADPLYIKLCRVQSCFRARLTPKPWRCGSRYPRFKFPRTSREEQALFETWEASYRTASERYATCRFVQAVGNRAAHPEISPIVSLHDNATRADSGLELA